MLKHVLGLLLAASSLATAQPLNIPAPPPARTSYCVPIAYRDYDLVLGKVALVRPAPGCQLPSLIRKVSDLSGEAGPPIEVHMSADPTAYTRQWLFVSHLEYSLNGQTWLPLRLRP